MVGTMIKRIGDGIQVNPSFTYSSNNNTEWMAVNELKDWIEKIKMI